MQNKRQHFIPQCYLRLFSLDKKNINVYSKKHVRKSPIQAIVKTAYKDYFYNIPQKIIVTNNLEISTTFYETEFFSKVVEQEYSKLVGKLTAVKIENEKITKPQPLTVDEKQLFAALIAVQYLRLPTVIDEYWETFRKTGSASLDIIKSFMASQHPDQKKFIDSIELDLDKDYKPVEHSNLYTDENLIANLQDLILDKIWIFHVTKDNFHTSDNPIIVKPHVPGHKPIYHGFGTYGSEIIFPLSSNVLLSMFDRKHFHEMECEHENYLIIDSKKTREYNCYQYFFSEQEVYSKINDFKGYELLKADNNGEDIFLKQSTTKIY